MVEGIKRHLDAGYKNATFAVNLDNIQMKRFVKKYLGPFIETENKGMVTYKML